MKIKDISVITEKNHIQTEVSFESFDFKDGCYLVQTVYLASDKEAVSCQMTVGIPSVKVMTSADAKPAIPSTKEKKYPYNLLTSVYDKYDCLIENKTVFFEFTLPEHKDIKEKNNIFRKVFGKKK